MNSFSQNYLTLNNNSLNLNSAANIGINNQNRNVFVKSSLGVMGSQSLLTEFPRMKTLIPHLKTSSNVDLNNGGKKYIIFLFL